MPADPTTSKKNWGSILKRNNALTRDNIRRALKQCNDDTDRDVLLKEMDQFDARYHGNRKAKTRKGFGVRNQQRQMPHEHHFFVEHLPEKPYCTNDLASGLKVRAAQQALAYRYPQYNSPATVWSVAQDIDRPVDDEYFDLRGAPRPNCVAKNTENGHAHALYFLAAGVCRASAGRLKPLRYLAAIEGALCHRLDADPSFAGLVTKNPLHPSWETLVVHDHLWTLEELAAPLDLSASANEKAYRDSGVGRNVTTFDTVRLWAYSAIRDFWGPGGFERWHRSVSQKIAEVNCQFPTPLPPAECKAIAKSIAGWTWKRITPDGLRELIQRTHTPEVQAERGRKAINQAAAGVPVGKQLAEHPEKAYGRLLGLCKPRVRAHGRSVRF